LLELQDFGPHETTIVSTRHVSWAQNITGGGKGREGCTEEGKEKVKKRGLGRYRARGGKENL